METVISQFITEWGTLGAVLLFIGYMMFENWKSSKNKNDSNKETVIAINNIGDKIDNLDTKINLVDTKVDEFKKNVDERINNVEDKMENLPETQIEQLDKRDNEKKEVHLKQLDDLMKLGPKLHRIIQDTNNKVGSDHIFIGSFHNGNASLTGIPYYKFDIIAERFSPIKVQRDCEFAHMYKDSDILRYDTLPILLIQQGVIHFDIPEDGDIEMSKYDDIIWRRMKGRGIKQIALRVLRDSKRTPSGFVGVVKYDHDKMNLDYLEDCGRELEEIYINAEKN